MSCEKYRKMISDWLDGEIHQRGEKKLFSHLERCQECREYLEFQKKIKSELAGSRIMDNSEEWWNEFEGRVRELVTEIRREEEKNSPAWFWKYLPAAGGVLAILVTIIFMIRFSSSDETAILTAATLSYEDMYLGLNQVLQEDENLARKISEELEKSIFEEISKGQESRIELYDYSEPELNENLVNGFQSENILPEGSK